MRKCKQISITFQNQNKQQSIKPTKSHDDEKTKVSCFMLCIEIRLFNLPMRLWSVLNLKYAKNVNLLLGKVGSFL